MNLEQKAVELLELLEGAAPQGLELLVQATYYESLFAIIVGFLFLAATVFLAYRGVRSWRNQRDVYDLSNDFLPVCAWWYTGAVFSGLVSLINLLSWWNWIGIVDPALRVANDILRGLGS